MESANLIEFENWIYSTNLIESENYFIEPLNLIESANLAEAAYEDLVLPCISYITASYPASPIYDMLSRIIHSLSPAYNRPMPLLHIRCRGDIPWAIRTGYEGMSHHRNIPFITKP